MGAPGGAGKPIQKMAMGKGGGTSIEQMLMSLDGLVIRQKKDWCEGLTGCQRENVYTAFAMGQGGESTGAPLLKFKEVSTCLQRCYCPANNRTFRMEVTNLMDNGKMVLEFYRPCGSQFSQATGVVISLV